MCQKYPFPSKKEAMSCVNLSKKRRGKNGAIRSERAYWCHECKGWHITSKKRFEVIAIEQLISELEHLKEAFKNGKQTDQKVRSVVQAVGLLIIEFNYDDKGINDKV